MSRISLDITQIQGMERAVKEFPGNAENAINHVLHTEGSPLLQQGILQLMPESGRKWKGKKRAAKVSKSLTDEKENLAVTVKTTKKYQYLYFADDGSNTRHHVGNQQFFLHGAELKEEQIVNRCIDELTKSFIDAVD